MTNRSDQDDAADGAKKMLDPSAAQNENLADAGGPLGGEPGAGGAGFGSGEPAAGGAKPSGNRAKSDAPISSDVAPIVHTSMDDTVRDVEEKAHRSTRPGADG